MQAPFSPDTVFRQSNRISSGSTIRKDGSLHRKSGSHRWQSAVADRYSQPARRYSCFGRVVQLDRADGTNSPLFTSCILNIYLFIYLSVPDDSEPSFRKHRFFRNYPFYSCLIYRNFASSNSLLHLPYIVRFIILSLLLVPSTKPLL